MIRPSPDGDGVQFRRTAPESSGDHTAPQNVPKNDKGRIRTIPLRKRRSKTQTVLAFLGTSGVFSLVSWLPWAFGYPLWWLSIVTGLLLGFLRECTKFGCATVDVVSLTFYSYSSNLVLQMFVAVLYLTAFKSPSKLLQGGETGKLLRGMSSADPEGLNTTIEYASLAASLLETWKTPPHWRTVLADPTSKPHGFVSVVIAAFNEHEYMERTLASLFDTTDLSAIKEILIVDDFSSPPLADSYNTTLFRDPWVRTIRNEPRKGLIYSKLTGGNEAYGDIIVFLDGHVKPHTRWLEPIVREISFQYKRVVVPSIPILDPVSWEEPGTGTGYKMMFDWDLQFDWFEDDNAEVPCMSGGLLAISKQWWNESGGYDPGMDVWGAENIEQSTRVWMCGGEIVVLRSSLIAHVFRSSFPYPVDQFKVVRNKARTVEGWFDNWKEVVYSSSRHIQNAAKRPMGSLEERQKLRRDMNCQTFDWYIMRHRNVFIERNMIPLLTFMIESVDYPGTCIHPFTRTNTSDPQMTNHLMASSCSEDNSLQLWNFFGSDQEFFRTENETDSDNHKRVTEWPINKVGSKHFVKLRSVASGYCPPIMSEIKKKIRESSEIDTDKFAAQIVTASCSSQLFGGNQLGWKNGWYWDTDEYLASSILPRLLPNASEADFTTAFLSQITEKMNSSRPPTPDELQTSIRDGGKIRWGSFCLSLVESLAPVEGQKIVVSMLCDAPDSKQQFRIVNLKRYTHKDVAKMRKEYDDVGTK